MNLLSHFIGPSTHDPRVIRVSTWLIQKNRAIHDPATTLALDQSTQKWSWLQKEIGDNAGNEVSCRSFWSCGAWAWFDRCVMLDMSCVGMVEGTLWNHYRVNFAIKIGDLYNFPFNKVIHINQFCYGHFLLCKFPSHMSNLLQLFPLWIFKSPLGSEYIILISIYDTHTHFGSKWWWLHNLNTAQP